ncbi:ParA family protein (plasmid) [Pediococcus siamensis]|uniref:ParA family protein n=1 Tax=Lactobacillaceae TaxID=33958 RepID=UPI001E5B2B88|nr:AAA family ATPase [Lactiplantibacillus plantarum]MCC6117611.1 AAA family ATPase [Lactiplantibacillus plantarum]MCW6115158.1 AAA family ATPase [Lactiplantibacillus plantarum]
MTATTLSFLNFKGGVGKTSTTALTSYSLARMGYKVLAIDLDPQANLTSLFLKTKSNTSDNKIITIEKSLMSALNDNTDLNKISISIMDNLDLIPNAVDFSMYNRFLDKNLTTEFEKVSFLKTKIEPLKSKFDFIFIDVPPTISLPNDTAFFACDQIIVVLQTQERSLSGAEILLKYLQDTLINTFGSSVDVMGILPVLSKRKAKVDEEILKSAIAEFGEDSIFKNKITIMERIKRMDMTGITDNSKDVWDSRVHEAFKGVAQEIVERLGS